MPYKKPCKICEKNFQPTSRLQRLCEKCFKEVIKKAQKKVVRNHIPLYLR